MVEIRPFCGLRYDISQVGDLSDVIAPPYDVIDADMQNDLYEKHPCNVVRLILNRDEPGDDSTDNRYARAAKFLRHWTGDGVLVRERDEALYVYHQQFHYEGTTYVRKGFLCRVRLERFGEGEIYAHEQTMPGPKADRLALTKACRANLSPIFSLFPDPDGTGQEPLEAVVRGKIPSEATDHLGVVHRIWPVTDHAAISQVRARLRETSVFIADGHHRYETAINYRDFLSEAGELGGDDSPPNFVMMHLVAMSDPGLAILPTHRLVSGLPELTSEELSETLGDHFSVESVGAGPDAAQETWGLIDADGGQDVFGFGTSDGKWILARLTDASPMESLAADQSEDWRALGVSVLHRLVLDHLLGTRYPDAELKCRYVRLLDEVFEAQDNRTCQLACLVPPAGMQHIEEIASHLEKMPAKSTYFYPKLLSGLVINPLDT